MAENEYTKREKTREVRFIYKTFICLETIINKFERLSLNLMEKKKQGWVINKYRVSNVNAKKITWILRNIIDWLMVFTFEQKN